MKGSHQNHREYYESGTVKDPKVELKIPKGCYMCSRITQRDKSGGKTKSIADGNFKGYYRT